MTLEQAWNAAGGVVVLAVGWLFKERAALRKDVSEADKRIAVLETRMESMPQTLSEIKGEIKGMRKDVSDALDKIHARIDSKADKP